jgi:tellurite methyltransferase
VKENPYDQRYAGPEFYWGKQPSSLCERVIELLRPGADYRPTLLDLGCGEGRDVVYFARCGFRATGLDLSLPGLEKARRYAQEAGVQIETIHADIAVYEMQETYDAIFSTGTLHYLPAEVRRERFEDYKAHTAHDGVHAITVLVEKPFLPPAPDGDTSEHLLKSGELLGYYWDWETVYFAEEIFDCSSSGVPHKHCANRIIARRYRGE